MEGGTQPSEVLGGHANPRDKSPVLKATVTLTRLLPKKFTFPPKPCPKYILITTGEPSTWPAPWQALAGFLQAELLVAMTNPTQVASAKRGHLS